MLVNNPRLAQHVFVGETEVFAANTPGASAWTALDLSAVVGARSVLVFLKAQAAQNNSVLVFRRMGDTDESYTATPAMALGAFGARPDVSGQFVYVACLTNGAGVLEWRSSAETVACTIDVVAFVA